MPWRGLKPREVVSGPESRKLPYDRLTREGFCFGPKQEPFSVPLNQ